MKSAERSSFLEPIILGSGQEAASKGLSLAIIRPKNTRFVYKKKKVEELAEEREAFKRAARQTSLLDKELEQLEPSPYDFRFKFEDASGPHDYQNGDWEAHAMFFNERRRSNEMRALQWMDQRFNEEYPKAGMAFAIGNQAKRPQTWQLLGVLRLDVVSQTELPF